MRSERKPTYPTSRFALKFATKDKAMIDMNTDAICENNFGQGDVEPGKAKLPWFAMDEKGFWRN